MPEIIFGGGSERATRAKLVQGVGPMLPGGKERSEWPNAIQLRPDEEGIRRGERMRVGIGDPGRQIMRLVDQQQGARHCETWLLEEQSAIARCEDVIVVANPDVVKREGGAGDFVRANLHFTSSGPKR